MANDLGRAARWTAEQPNLHPKTVQLYEYLSGYTCGHRSARTNLALAGGEE